MSTNYTNITLADDDEDDRMFFEDAFAELKLQTKVTTYNDGAQLMEYLNDSSNSLPDLLFLDLNMPKKSGLECLKEIKQQPRLKQIAIAIYSTSASEQDIENTFVTGANVYIKKPNNFKQLKKVLSQVVTTNWQYQNSNLNRDNFLLRL